MLVPPSSPIAPIFEPVAPTELVSFTVLCRPASGIGLDEFRVKLTASEIDALVPDAKTLADVAARLRKLGFEVFDRLVFPDRRPGLAVFARGAVELFEKVFRTTLTRMTRRSLDEQTRDREPVSIAIVVAGDAPWTGALGSDAILISVAEPPLLESVGTAVSTAVSTAVCLSLPNGVAHETHADAVHTSHLFLRGMATGRGVRVAVVDTGFASHPYFDAYQVTRIAAPYASGASLDESHGTAVLANLLACAPGADAWGVKFFNAHTGFMTAMYIPKVRVISMSWVFPIGLDPMPSWVVMLEYFVQYAVRNMGIVVVVPSGNRTGETTPARLQDVIAVGGAAVGPPATVNAWPLSSAFTSTVYGVRSVPDLCGIASQINLPVPPADWECSAGGTSCATPQVAGVAALLLQKKSTLSPRMVRDTLTMFATDITSGVAYLGVQAGPDQDNATGAGLVNAQESWQHVTDAWWTWLWAWLWPWQ
jgi:serine protease AprX